MPAARQITDRAKRYRAQKTVRGKKVCAICGKRPRRIDVMHLDGNESHGEAANLAYGCRSCNGRLAVAFKRIGAGRPTNQYNPAGGHVPTFEQYAWAVSQQRHSGEHGEHGAIIHATPKKVRTQYAKEILRKAWRTRRAAHEDRWNPSEYGVLSGMPREALPAGVKAYQVSYDKGYAAGFRKGSLPAGSAKAFQDGFRDARRRAGNPTWGGRPMTQAQRDAAYAQEERDEAEAAKHAEWVRAQELKKLRGNPPKLFYRDVDKHGRERFYHDANVGRRMTLYSPEAAKLLVATGQARVVEKKKRNPSKPPGLSTIRKWMHYSTATLRGMLDLPEQQVSAATKRSIRKMLDYRATRGNPAAASAEVYKEFHGHSPREVVTVVKRVHVHEHLAAAGALRRLVVLGIDKRKHTIRDFGGAILAFNENKNQLFVEGGDQSLNLEDYGIDSPHELETLGKVQKIDYKADKSHLGAEGGRATYTHQFRTTNENGRHVVVSVSRYPDLVYDVPNQQLLFSGGSYTIRAEGIDV